MVAGLGGDGKVVYQLSVPEVDHPEAVVTALFTEVKYPDPRFVQRHNYITRNLLIYYGAWSMPLRHLKTPPRPPNSKLVS